MNKKGISIIVPCYNAGIYLRDCIDSILAQPFIHPFEIIVVDDGSNENETLKELRGLSSKKNIRIIKLQKNVGVQKARNIGLTESFFDYVFTMDADDKLNTDRAVLEDGAYADRAIHTLENDIDVAFVHGSCSMFEEFHGYTISAYPVTEELILKKHHVQTNIVYRKKDAFLCGKYDERINKWQDWSFGVALLNGRYRRGEKNKISFHDQPFYLYRIHDKATRISAATIDEFQMIRLTIINCREIFMKYYKNLDIEETAEAVLHNKPSKLIDLLYIASQNLPRAIEMVKQRGGELKSSKEPIGIP